MTEMMWPEILAMSLLSFFTAAFSGATGMGGGAIFLAGLTLPLSKAIPIHAVVQLMSNWQRVFFLRSYLRKDIFWPFILGCLISLFVAIWVRGKVTNEIIPYALVVLILSYNLFRPKKLPAIHLGKKGFFALGFMAGFLGVVIGLVGPLLGPFFLRDDMSAPEIVANKSFAQSFVHICKVPAFFYFGFNYLDYAIPIASFLVFGLFGTWVGVKLLHRIKRDTFYKVYKVLLFVVTIKVAYSLYLLIEASL